MFELLAQAIPPTSDPAGLVWWVFGLLGAAFVTAFGLWMRGTARVQDGVQDQRDGWVTIVAQLRTTIEDLTEQVAKADLRAERRTDERDRACAERDSALGRATAAEWELERIRQQRTGGG